MADKDWPEVSKRINALLNADEVDAALAAAQHAVKNRRDRARAYFLLARANLLKGNLDAATAAIDKAGALGVREGHYLKMTMNILWADINMVRYGAVGERLRKMPERDTPDVLRKLARANLKTGNSQHAEKPGGLPGVAPHPSEGRNEHATMAKIFLRDALIPVLTSAMSKFRPTSLRLRFAAAQVRQFPSFRLQVFT